jgi:hypothetical protein
MPKEISVGEVYFKSTEKLRAALPKFIIFLGTASLMWLFGVSIFLPLSEGILLGDLEASAIVNLILIVTIIILCIGSFREVRATADAIAGFVIFYVGRERSKVSELRLMKLRGVFRSLAYVMLASVVFLMFKGALGQIHPLLPGMGVILLVIWAIISLYSVGMAVGSEVEEAARIFAKDVEKRMKKGKS